MSRPVRTLTEKPGCLWAGLYRRSHPNLVRPLDWTGLDTVLGPRTPTFIHPQEKWTFLGNTELEIFAYMHFQRNVHYINIKLKSGNPCARPCTAVNQVGFACGIGSHQHNCVNLRLNDSFTSQKIHF